jgi:hypothetical protein
MSSRKSQTNIVTLQNNLCYLLNMSKFHGTITAIGLLLSVLLPQFALAQGRPDPIYLSGVVIDGSTSESVPNVHLYIPKAGRGTASNGEGFFMLPTMPGDSIILSSIGYKKRYYIVPKSKSESYSVVIELLQDTTNLPIVEVFPYPTEEIFKETFLALELPNEEQERVLRENLDRQFLLRMSYDLPMDASQNARWGMNQNVYRIENRYSIPTLQVLNPFAWAKFIQSVKRGDFKKGKWKDRK